VLFGEDEPETEVGAERAQTTCMVQAYACLVVSLCSVQMIAVRPNTCS
jgi:hypothetical protein